MAKDTGNSEWVKCTIATDPASSVFVNLAVASIIKQHGRGTRIAFAGGETNFTDVLESPEEILNLPRIKQAGG